MACLNPIRVPDYRFAQAGGTPATEASVLDHRIGDFDWLNAPRCPKK
jgi:hypothetical protein